MPGTASAASSAAAARATSASVSGSAASARSSGAGSTQRGLLGEAAVRVLRHHARHRHRALGELRKRRRVDRGRRYDGGAVCRRTRAGRDRGPRTARRARSGRAGAARRDGGAGDQHRVRGVRPGALARDRSGPAAARLRPSRRQLLRDLGERGTREAGPSAASVGRPRNSRAAARCTSASVTALSFATVSAVGITRPNTWSCRASCSQRLPVLSSDISSDAFTCARARASSGSRHFVLHLAQLLQRDRDQLLRLALAGARRRCRTGRRP